MSDQRLLFVKEGRARYISHLDLMHTMQRAFIRAGLLIRHTAGFNPHPYMSFALPLSVGQESKCELMDFGLISDTSLDKLPGILNSVLPEGLKVLSAYNAERKLTEIKWLSVSGLFTYDSGVPESAAEKLSEFFSSESIPVEKRGKKGVSDIDIIPMLKSAVFTQNDACTLTLNAVVAAQNPSLNPSLLLSALDRHIPALSPDFALFTRTEIFDQDMKLFR